MTNDTPKIDDGGPAFPFSASKGNFTRDGMTLRDWFAGQALVALPHIGSGANLRFRELAEEAYLIADAMLAARNVSKS